MSFLRDATGIDVTVGKLKHGRAAFFPWEGAGGGSAPGLNSKDSREFLSPKIQKAWTMAAGVGRSGSLGNDIASQRCQGSGIQRDPTQLLLPKGTYERGREKKKTNQKTTNTTTTALFLPFQHLTAKQLVTFPKSSLKQSWAAASVLNELGTVTV